LKLASLQARGIEKSYLFEIVSNYRNGIDVDKFDYFDRDCINLGFTNNFDYKRYIACTRVIQTDDNPSKIAVNQICVRDKEICNLYEMYHVREYLTRRAYKHETGSSINLMVVEALSKADK
jgi:HD superfamily phosphohydrolase